LRARGWILFGVWALEGAVFALGVLAAASFGLFLVPLAALLLWWLARTAGASAEMLGAVSGAGVPTLVVAILERGPDGLDARPWLVAGLLLVALGIGSYAFLRRRAQPPSAVV
jgi:hypothetical protein